MNGLIYLLDDDGNLAEMREQPYDSEALLQGFLESHPALLPGDQIDPAEPRRWLLVTRELGVPGEPDGADRWALDHLFLDQQGVPTLVEVKRSSDSRIRREVVGQMLDYAANAVAYLPVEGIKARFEETCREKQQEPLFELYNALGKADADVFWRLVGDNLKAGRVRLVFVADLIPPELQRVVEFLNAQMDPAEVLAVEIKQFVSDGGLRTLVPRVIGRTAAAEAKKSPGGRTARTWDEPTFFAELVQRHGAAVATAARAIYDHAGASGWDRDWWKGENGFVIRLRENGRKHTAAGVWVNGEVGILFSWMKDQPPFDDPALRDEFRNRLTSVPAVTLPAARLDKQPSFPLAALTDPAARQQFLDVLDWWAGQVRSAAPTPPSSEPA